MIAERNNIPNAIAQITCKRIIEYDGSKYHKKLFTTISKKISQIPLVNKNLDRSYLFFLDPYKYAEVPVNKTKTGAQ